MTTEERAAAIEACAQICDRMATSKNVPVEANDAAWNLAVSIRALASAQPSDTAQAGGVEAQARRLLRAQVGDGETGLSVWWGGNPNIPAHAALAAIRQALAASPRSPNDDMQSVEALRKALEERAQVACDAECDGDRGLHDVGCIRAAALTRPDEAPTADKRGEGA